MKKQYLLLLSIVISTLAIAQTKPATYGIRAGITSSGMRGDAVSNLNNLIDYANGMVTTTNHTGFFAGPYISIPIGDVMSVEPALYYSQKGYELKGALNIKGVDLLGANAKAILNSQYIDVPVVLKANLKGFQIFAGPQISYLTKADFKATAGVLGFNLLNSKMDATNQFNRWDAGVTAGIGYQLPKGVNIMASYDYGLSKVDANKSLNSYNHSVKVGIGMSF